MFRILAYSYPNNEIRAVFSAVPALRTQLPLDDDGEEIGPDYPLSENIGEVAEEKNATLSLVSNSKTLGKTVGYGLLPLRPTSFGINAKRKIIRAGGALEKSINSPSECLFLTGTLPGSTEESFKAIAQYSGYVVNALKAWVSNRVRSKLDFYCWEYQKRGALHFHYCVHVPDDEARSQIKDGFKEWWIGILKRVGEKSGTDLFRKNDKYTHLSDTSKVRAVAEICRKSPSRYLAKYLSKSANCMKGRARFFTPSRWWGTSRPLKSLLESMTLISEIIEGSYFACVKKMQEVKASFECGEGKQYKFRHKYGMGETLLAYPSSDDENVKLFEDLEDMSTMDKINKQLETFRPSSMLRPHKSRLLKWSYHWIDSLPNSETGMIESLKEFHLFLISVEPTKSTEPLMLVYEWRNKLWNLNECIGYSKCGRNYEDRKMIDKVLCDLEIAIHSICKYGWQ